MIRVFLLPIWEKYGEAIVYFDKSLKINGSNIHAMVIVIKLEYFMVLVDTMKQSPTMIRYSK